MKSTFQLPTGNKVFIIAELSANHGNDIEVAKETVRAAKRAGADAIKLQTYKPSTITLDVKKEDFWIKGGTIWDGAYLFDLYKEAMLPWEWHKELFDTAKEEGLVCFSSPFDKTAIDLLEELNCPIYKIASLEITDIPLIELAASKGKPVILSTGVADEKDIELAVEACRRMGNNQIALLKCTTEYPAKIEECNLKMIQDLAQRFNVVAGLSDHTLGITVPIVSVALGARIIEKHFILDKKVGGPDASFSLDEKEFTEMVAGVRAAESAIGVVDYNLTESQKRGRTFARSLYVAEDIKVGEVFTEENVRSVRPGYGMHPKFQKIILGKKALMNLEKGTPMREDFFEGNK